MHARSAEWERSSFGRRAYGSGLRRFVGLKPHADLRSARLAPDNAALAEARTIFRSTVVRAQDAPRLLVSGTNSAKLGGEVRKGIWRGCPIYQLTLEERASCPRSCHAWSECYGNSMPLARRHQHGPALERRLRAELRALALCHPAGFVVRLHVLGDFYSPAYAARWAAWLAAIPALRVFGYTAQPESSPVGQILSRCNQRWPDRCAIRFSMPNPTGLSMETVTIWRQPEGRVVPEGIVCPAQTHATDCCGTCGLCWAPPARSRTIVFVGHGKRGRRRV